MHVPPPCKQPTFAQARLLQYPLQHWEASSLQAPPPCLHAVHVPEEQKPPQHRAPAPQLAPMARHVAQEPLWQAPPQHS